MRFNGPNKPILTSASVFQDVKIDPFTMIKVTLSVNDILTMDFTYVLAMIYIY
jgi:hypothetical protein